MIRRSVAITGATGYLGNALSCALLARRHEVCALVRPGTAHRAAPGAWVREVDLFAVEELFRALRPGDTLVHLVGTPHPSPRKAEEFLSVDLASVRTCAAPPAARASRVLEVPEIRDAPMIPL